MRKIHWRNLFVIYCQNRREFTRILFGTAKEKPFIIFHLVFFCKCGKAFRRIGLWIYAYKNVLYIIFFIFGNLLFNIAHISHQSWAGGLAGSINHYHYKHFSL